MLTSEETSHELFIGGERVNASTAEYFTTTDPATGEELAKVAAGGSDDIDRAVSTARETLPEWRSKSPVERGQLVRDIAERIRNNAEELASIESRDQGKPLSQARSDIEDAARYFEYYAGAADKLEGESIPLGADSLNLTTREPYGVSGQIVPWNFPLSITARGVAPALVAGNTVVVKPAPTTPLSALSLAEICSDAGIPDGVVNVVTGGTEPGVALSSHAASISSRLRGVYPPERR